MIWNLYYRALWSVRCYAWNPLVSLVNWIFDQADWQIRKRLQAKQWASSIAETATKGKRITVIDASKKP